VLSTRERALSAINKPAPYGPDIDLSKYRLDEPGVEEAGELDSTVLNAASRVGLESTGLAYVQSNERALYTAIAKALEKYSVLVLPTREALTRKPHARSLAWRLLDPASDKYTAHAYLYGGELGTLYTCRLVLKFQYPYTHV
jgi:hypothetical protein